MSDSDEYFQENATKSIKPTSFLKCIKIIEQSDDLKKMFRYNELKNCIEFSNAPAWDQVRMVGHEVTDNDIINLRVYLSKKYNFSPSIENIYQALLAEALTNRYHPIKEYLNYLHWDGINRLDRWLPMIVGCDKNIYTQAIGRKLICALIERTFNPGVKYDFLVILEGEQGTGKSTLIKNIAGHEYYTSVGFHQTDKDIIDIMRGKWILEIEEMADFKKQDVERVKSLLSRGTDRVRLSYGRLAEDYPRSSIMIGSLNPKGNNRYLQDETGNRRFWPIACEGKINNELFLDIRDQLFAEGCVVYRQKSEKLFLDEEEAVKISMSEQEQRKDYDPWEEVIEDYLEHHSIIDRVTTSDVLEKCLNMQKDKMNRGYASRVGSILRKLGWEYKRESKRGPERKTYFSRPLAEITTEEVFWNEQASTG